jgi:hypothetical protein
MIQHNIKNNLFANDKITEINPIKEINILLDTAPKLFIKDVKDAIICRKCGGPHFTIKCGKEKKEIIIEKPPIDFSKNKQKYEKRPYFKTTYRVKLAELPKDMTEEELMLLTCDWGHIVRIKLLNYEESSVAYIDFGYEEEADYFVQALDKTSFDQIILLVCRVSNYKPSPQFNPT